MQHLQLGIVTLGKIRQQVSLLIDFLTILIVCPTSSVP